MDWERFFPDTAAWIKKAIERRLGSGKLTLVSAVCPDYEREYGRFTYRSMGEGIPYTAQQHLAVLAAWRPLLSVRQVQINYVITLADTEFDLPLVVRKMAQGQPEEFLRKCQASCDLLHREAVRAGLPLTAVGRFTQVFPEWFANYQAARQIIAAELEANGSVYHDLQVNTANRSRLYRAMAQGEVDLAYCQEMVIRQWAQYMAWGECATGQFGDKLIMINHDTPNLSRVNHPAMRRGRERIPILKLNISTMP